MTFLGEKLKKLKEEGRKALVGYMMVGYPDYDTSLKAFEILLSEGVDILELGFPFSDPVADGPTIQLAHEVALKNGITSKEVFETARRLKVNFPEVPIVLMTYYNPIFRMGLERFCERAKENLVDGFIVPDLPPEESGPLKEATNNYELSLVLLASPTSTEKRLKLICTMSDDMVYFVSVTGTTGARRELPFEELEENLKRYKSVCSKPVVVGFGVSKREHAERISAVADGVVVGSLFVRLAGKRDLKYLAEAVRDLSKGVKHFQIKERNL